MARVRSRLREAARGLMRVSRAFRADSCSGVANRRIAAACRQTGTATRFLVVVELPGAVHGTTIR